MGDINIHNIKHYIDKYNLSTFVETGTLYGDSINSLKDQFNELYSIEIDKDLADQASNRFKDISKIKIYNGNSLDALRAILPKIKTNILFWLDAHFPGADAHKVAYNSTKEEHLRIPLEYELSIIRNHEYNNVIIIDDLWLYEDGLFEWGTFNEHSKKCNMGVTRKELMGDRDSSFIYALFENSHLITKDYRHQGYLILEPRSTL